VEGFLAAWGRFSIDNPLRSLLKRIEEAQEPPPALSDPYRAAYPQRSESERHVEVVDWTDVRPDREWPRSWERARKLGNGRQAARQDPIKAAYAKRHKQRIAP
jgi:hypothetical protein